MCTLLLLLLLLFVGLLVDARRITRPSRLMLASPSVVVEQG
jgi:hypothetical protein